MLTDITPLLQIATAVILAVLVYAFRRALLKLGTLLAVIGVLLVMLAYGLWIGTDTLVTGNEYIGLWAAVIGFYGAVLAGLAGVDWHLRQRAKRNAATGSA